MTRHLIVINHWGGVPTALHRNAVVDLQNQIPNSKEWYTCDSVPLSRFDPACSFRECLLFEDRADKLCLIPTIPDANHSSCLLSSFAAAGYRVVVLGASGIDAGRATDTSSAVVQEHRHHSEGMPDPTRSMKDWGVDACSLYDGAHFRGAAHAHDRQVLREAHECIENERHDNEPLLLWINLLSCRDVYDLRFRTKAHSSSKSGFVLPRPPVALDPRVQPPHHDASLGEWLAVLNEDDATQYGENDLKGKEMSIDASLQYAALLDYSWSVLQTLHRLLGTLIARCSSTSEIVVTASHAMSLGESGTRVAGPFGANSHTFWMSTVDVSLSPSAAGLSSLFVRLAGSLGVPHTTLARPVPNRCMGLVLGQLTARVTVRLNDHVYECILAWPEDLPRTGTLTHLSTDFQLLSVCVDGMEQHNVIQHIPHLLDEVMLRLKRSLPTHACLPAEAAPVTTSHSTQTKSHSADPTTTAQRVWSELRHPPSDPIPIPSPRLGKTQPLLPQEDHLRLRHPPSSTSTHPLSPPPLSTPPLSSLDATSSNPFGQASPPLSRRSSQELDPSQTALSLRDEETSSVSSYHNVAALARARSSRNPNTVRSVEARLNRRVR